MSTEPTIRRAMLRDAAVISELTNLAYSKYVPRIGRKPQPMTTDYQHFVENHPVWVLEVEEQIAGVLVLQNEESALLIYSVAIHPEQQQRGYGRLLLAWAEEEAKKAGYATIRLYTNALMEENIALYTRLGYQETGREPLGSNVRVHMSKGIHA